MSETSQDALIEQSFERIHSYFQHLAEAQRGLDVVIADVRMRDESFHRFEKYHEDKLKALNQEIAQMRATVLQLNADMAFIRDRLTRPNAAVPTRWPSRPDDPWR